MTGKSNLLPPGQHEIKNLLKWGIDHPTISGSVPTLDLNNWVLTVYGDVASAVKLNWQDFLGLPKTQSTSNFHCVEGWSVLHLTWEGVSFEELVKLVKPKSVAKYVLFECADQYTTSLSLEELLHEKALLAYKLNKKYLDICFGAPLRLIIPNKYAYKNAMWLQKIRFTSQKEFGYWEKRGYSDTAAVWMNDRFRKVQN